MGMVLLFLRYHGNLNREATPIINYTSLNKQRGKHVLQLKYTVLGLLLWLFYKIEQNKDSCKKPSFNFWPLC